jgi:maltose/moltooligosaccharide transporter
MISAIALTMQTDLNATAYRARVSVLQGAAMGGSGQARQAGRHQLSRWQLGNLCFGLFGVQIVWGLQNANTSRIFQTLGARIDELPMLWIAGPIAGLLVQPIIGEWSDRTSSRWGRRRPFMVAGALLAAIALVVMAGAKTLWAASLMLWLLTISVNIVMEPFRALMADLVPDKERDGGFAMQALFIGAGAVFASILPWAFVHWAGLPASSPAGEVPMPVRLAFYTGAAGLLIAVGWTVLSTRERPLTAADRQDRRMTDGAPEHRGALLRRGAKWVALAVIIAAANAILLQRREGYLLAAVVGTFGGLYWLASRSGLEGRGPVEAIASEIIGMPAVMRRLALVQFFTWFGLFAMWVYTVPAVAGRYYGNPAAGTPAFEGAANWVGILFAGYNGVAALVALALPAIVRRLGRRKTHALCLAAGAAGLMGLIQVGSPAWLWLPIVAIGCAWASILSIPYAIVAQTVRPERMGVYMGIHNIFLVLPQLVAASVLGPFVGGLLNGDATGALALAGAALLVAAVLSLTVPTAE